ncbi:MAG: hypothetical protein EOP04_06900 [Proteobacteria bacterium]|nr:MAG: hypothetical protein EOP04_06900 [Pseudomonadota bacterium]
MKNQLLLLLSLTLLTNNAFAQSSDTCDRKTKPWLDESCQEPKSLDPNNACLRVSMMKAQGISFEQSVALNAEFKNVRIEKPEDLTRSMQLQTDVWAWELCSSVVTMKCTQSANALAQKYSSSMDKMIISSDEGLEPYVDAKSNSKRLDVNLIKNLKSVTDSQLQFLNDLLVLSRNYQSGQKEIGTEKALYEADRTLYRAASLLRNQAIDLSLKENRYIDLLKSSKSQLQNYAEEGFAYAKHLNCSDVAQSMQIYNDDVKNHFDSIHPIRTLFIENRNRRDLLFSEVYKKLKYSNHKIYTSKTGSEIKDLQLALHQVLALDDFLFQTDEWWNKANTGGLGQRLHTKYYFYSAPLEILNKNKAEGLAFRKQIQEFTADPASIAAAIKIMDERLNIIDASLSFLSTKGWVGLLELQKTSAKSRAALLPENKACQQASTGFIQTANSVSNLESFDAASVLYKISVDTCVK